MVEARLRASDSWRTRDMGHMTFWHLEFRGKVGTLLHMNERFNVRITTITFPHIGSNIYILTEWS